MRRLKVWLIISVCAGLVLLPLVLWLGRRPWVMTLLPVSPRTSSSGRYSAESRVKGYALTLIDVSYLDYLVATLDLFSPDAVVDPVLYTAGPLGAKRRHIDHITFQLVDAVDQPISIVGRAPGLHCRGDYVLDGTILVDRVAVESDVTGKQKFIDKYARENSFLHCALNTLHLAKGVREATASRQGIVDITFDIDKNIYSGLFAWPFRITQEPS